MKKPFAEHRVMATLAWCAPGVVTYRMIYAVMRARRHKGDVVDYCQYIIYRIQRKAGHDCGISRVGDLGYRMNAAMAERLRGVGNG